MIDLHIHTTASDGADTPLELLEKVRALGLRRFSVTDHDTVAGALELLGQPGFVPGVEFSCQGEGGKCHILGYGYDHRCPQFQEALDAGRQLRLDKLNRRLNHLRENFGILLTAEEMRWLLGQNAPGKPHLGQLLRDRGLAPDLSSAIRSYLDGVPGRDRIEAKTAIDAIRAAGGIAVWAHPLGGEGERRLTAAQLDERLTLLRRDGIQGMECWYSRYTLAEVELLRSRAEGLVITGGSDYHGSNKENLALGQLNVECAPAFGIWEGFV